MVSRNERGSEHLSSYTKDQLLALSQENQKTWVEKQDWFQKEDFEQSLYAAEITALAVPDLEEDVRDCLTDYQEYGTAGILLENGHITEERADHLEAHGDFNEEEKAQLKQCLIDRAIENGDVNEARSLSFNLDGKEVLVTFYGTYHPQGGLNVQFLGIFESKNQIEEAMSDVGVVIENFMEGVTLNG